VRRLRRPAVMDFRKRIECPHVCRNAGVVNWKYGLCSRCDFLLCIHGIHGGILETTTIHEDRSGAQWMTAAA
jgi:hypothetical protein